MPVDFAMTTGALPIDEVRDDLAAIVAELTHAVIAQQRPTQSEHPRDMALNLKAQTIELPTSTGRHFRWKSGQHEQLGEVVNQLATMTRLLDAMHWVAQVRPRGQVIHCNPTTSNIGSDLEIRGPDAGPWSFEVSDTLRRNANRKINKDIATLLRLPDEHRRLLVTSGVNATYRPAGHLIDCVATIRTQDGKLEVLSGPPEQFAYTDTVLLELLP